MQQLLLKKRRGKGKRFVSSDMFKKPEVSILGISYCAQKTAPSWLIGLLFSPGVKTVWPKCPKSELGAHGITSFDEPRLWFDNDNHPITANHSCGDFIRFPNDARRRMYCYIGEIIEDFGIQEIVYKLCIERGAISRGKGVIYDFPLSDYVKPEDIIDILRKNKCFDEEAFWHGVRGESLDENQRLIMANNVLAFKKRKQKEQIKPRVISKGFTESMLIAIAEKAFFDVPFSYEDAKNDSDIPHIRNLLQYNLLSKPIFKDHPQAQQMKKRLEATIDASGIAQSVRDKCRNGSVDADHVLDKRILELAGFDPNFEANGSYLGSIDNQVKMRLLSSKGDFESKWETLLLERYFEPNCFAIKIKHILDELASQYDESPNPSKDQIIKRVKNFLDRINMTENLFDGREIAS